MEFNEYQKLAARTMNGDLPQEPLIVNMAMGLSGEVGETVDLLKKALFHGHQLDAQELLKEMGDVLWYLSGLASAVGFDLDDVAVTNIGKLMDRYPDGFSQEASVNRNDESTGE